MSREVSFKGKQGCLEVLVAPQTPFEAVKQSIIEKFESSRQFFAGTACVRIVGALEERQREELKELLRSQYQIVTVDFAFQEETLSVPIAEPRGKRDPLFWEFDEGRPQRPSEENLQSPILSRTSAPEHSQATRTVQAVSQPASLRKAPRVRRAEVQTPQHSQKEQSQLDLREGTAHARENRTLFVEETIRSGQRIAYEGDIVILGDVNSGAEIVAEGSIVVMGSLRGVAHAGARGDEGAAVSAFRLQPMQLRIGGHIAIAPEGDDKGSDYPEKAFVQEGEIIILPISRSRGMK